MTLVVIFCLVCVSLSNYFSFIGGAYNKTENYAKYGYTFSSENIPGGRNSFSMFILPSKPNSMFIFGGNGFTNYSIGYLNDIWEYNIAMNEWKLIKGSYEVDSEPFVENALDFHGKNIPGGWGDMNGFYLSDGFVVYGGVMNQSATNTRWIFSVSTSQWKQVHPKEDYNKGTTGEYGSSVRIPSGYNGNTGSLDVSDTIGIHFGGHAFDDGVLVGGNGHMNDVWLYDKTSHNISHRSGSIPTRNVQATIVGGIGVYDAGNIMRSSYECTMWLVERIEGKPSLFTFGGTDGTSQRNDLWEFDIETSLWRIWINDTQTETSETDYEFRSTNTPGLRYAATGWSSGNNEYLYLYGGFYNGYNDASSSFWVYSVVYNQWKFEVGGRRGSKLPSNIGDGVEIDGDPTNIVLGGSQGMKTVYDPSSGKHFVWGSRVYNDLGDLVFGNLLLSFDDITCFSSGSDGVSFCSGHGACVNHDVCECEDYYYGKDCSVTTCDGVFSNDTFQACNETKYECSAYDTCTPKKYFTLLVKPKNTDNPYLSSISSTSDGGYISCGRGTYSSVDKAYIYKFSSEGSIIEWERVVESAVGMDVCVGIYELEGHGYVYAGHRINLVMLDYDGNFKWGRGLEDSNAVIIGSTMVYEEAEGRYVIYLAGTLSSLMFIAKLDAVEGSEIWCIRIQYSGNVGKFYYVSPTEDGNILAVGDTSGGGNAIVYKLSPEGDIIWGWRIGHSTGGWTKGFRAMEVDGYIYVLGEREEVVSTTYYSFIVKILSSNGTIAWRKYFDSRGYFRSGIRFEEDGSFLMVGNVYVPGLGYQRVGYIRFDSDFTTVTDSKYLPLNKNNYASVEDMYRPPDGSVLLAGYSSDDLDERQAFVQKMSFEEPLSCNLTSFSGLNIFAWGNDVLDDVTGSDVINSSYSQQSISVTFIDHANIEAEVERHCWSCDGVFHDEEEAKLKNVCGNGECLGVDDCRCFQGSREMENPPYCGKEGFEFLTGHVADSASPFTGSAQGPSARRSMPVLHDSYNDDRGFYLVGGYQYNGALLNDLWYFDGEDLSWLRIQEHTGSEDVTSSDFHPSNQIGTQCLSGFASSNTSGFVWGSYSDTGGNRGKLYELSFSKREWRRLRNDVGKPMNVSIEGQFGPDVYLSEELSCLCSLYIPERSTIIFAGGNNGTGDMNDVWEYSISLNQFRFVKGSMEVGTTGNMTSVQNVFNEYNLPPCFKSVPNWRFGEDWYFPVEGEQGLEMWILDVIDSFNWKYFTFSNPTGGGPMVKGEFDPSNCPGPISFTSGWRVGNYFFSGGDWESGRSSFFVFSARSHEWAFLDGRTSWNDTSSSDSTNDLIGSFRTMESVYIPSDERAIILIGYGRYDNGGVKEMDAVWSYRSPYICFDAVSTVNTTQVCSGRGNCTFHDICDCSFPYSGPNCEFSDQCFGDTNEKSCSEHGRCNEVDTCLCDTFYHGDVCNVTDCFGYFSNDTENVCNGHGDCFVYQQCSCFKYYGGPECGIVTAVFEYVQGDRTGNSTSVNMTCNLPSSLPGGRSRSVGGSFGSSGVENFYVFGGFGHANTPRNTAGHLSDLWSYDVSKMLWCYIKGSDEINSFENQFGVADHDMFDDEHLPGARSNHVVFSSHFSMFVFGGERSEGYDLFGQDKNATNALWELSVIGRPLHHHQWRLLVSENHKNITSEEEQPSPRYSSCAGQKWSARSSVSSTVFLFGGIEKISGMHSIKNDLWVYDIQSNEFTRIREGSVEEAVDKSWNMTRDFYDHLVPLEKNGSMAYNPSERFDHICWVGGDGDFFVFGGTLRNLLSVNDVWTYNVTQNAWIWIHSSNLGMGENLIENFSGYDSNNVPSSRSEPVYFRNQEGYNEILFFGGINRQFQNTFSDVWAFSNGLFEFKFVNGSSLPNQSNLGDEFSIGSRYSALGVKYFTNNRVFLIFGGES